MIPGLVKASHQIYIKGRMEKREKPAKREMPKKEYFAGMSSDNWRIFIIMQYP